MRIGIPEIIAIVIIFFAILLIARIVRFKPGDTAQGKESPTDITHGLVEDVPGRIRNYGKRLGIAFLIAGMLFGMAGISMFRWAAQSYVWAFGAVILGFALLFLSRKK